MTQETLHTQYALHESDSTPNTRPKEAKTCRPEDLPLVRSRQQTVRRMPPSLKVALPRAQTSLATLVLDRAKRNKFPSRTGDDKTGSEGKVWEALQSSPRHLVSSSA